MQSAINTHEVIDSLYPLFCVRISSYHRIFSDRDSAVYYAKEVLRTAPAYKQLEKEAVGHMLMGMLVDRNKTDERLMHYKAAGSIFKKIEDHAGYGYMTGSITGWYFEKGNYIKALAYSDTTIASARQAIKEGFEEHWHLSSYYRFRGEIFRRLGDVDSAWHYLNKGYRLELDHIDESNNEKVLEINARYEDEKREQTLAEQAQEIKFEKDRRNLLIGIIGLVLIFASLLTYYYMRLQKANHKMKGQSEAIKQNNQELSKSLQRQIILQSEVHHRVKNNLQIIISLLEIQKEDIEEPEIQKNLDTMANRVYSMAAIHEILYQQKDMAQISLLDYAENLCMHFSNLSIEEEKPSFNIDMDNRSFNLETSMPLGIILTELLTNSLKYARVEGQKLKVDIQLQKLEDQFCLKYNDNGPGFSEGELTERKKGLGTYLLKSMSRQLNGYLETRNENGASFSIFFKEKPNILTQF